MIYLRRADSKDLHVIHEMQKAAFKDLLDRYQDYDTNPGAESQERLAEKMAQKDSDYYLITKHERLIGACRVVTGDTVHRISPMFILPEFQGHGYGKAALYQLAVIHTRHKIWQLSTIKEEGQLCAFYEACGYVQTGARQIRPGMTLVNYEKHLTPITETLLSQVIEKMQTDHEKSQAQDKIAVARSQDYCMINNLESKSIYSTRVVYGHEGHLSKEDLWQKAHSFFGDKKFSWWVSLPRDQEILTMIRGQGYKVLDHYHGRYKALEAIEPVAHEILEVDGADDKAILDLAMTTFEIWETDPSQVDFAVKRYKSYLSAEDRRGAYLLIYVAGEPAGYANYRFSKCQRFLYLSGTGVKKQYRKQGIYRSLLNYRLNLGKTHGARYAVTQARVGHSSPILEKAGFSKLDDYQFLIPGN